MGWPRSLRRCAGAIAAGIRAIHRGVGYGGSHGCCTPVDDPKLANLAQNSRASCCLTSTIGSKPIWTVSFAQRHLWNVGFVHSGLMFASLSTFAHFSVSSAMKLPKSAAEITNAEEPRSASRALSLGSASPALISLLSVSTISAGVFLGDPRQNNALAS